MFMINDLVIVIPKKTITSSQSRKREISTAMVFATRERLDVTVFDGAA